MQLTLAGFYVDLLLGSFFITERKGCLHSERQHIFV